MPIATINVGNNPKPSGKNIFQDIGHQFNRTLQHYDQVLRSHNSPDIYVGGSYGVDGFNPNIQITQQSGGYSGIPNGKPTAYSGNAAKTASSIKQGGMTKNEVQEFNSKHPNETAWRLS